MPAKARYIAPNRRLRHILVAVATAVSFVIVDGMPSRALREADSGTQPAFAPGQIVVGYLPGATEATRTLVRETVPASSYRAMPTLDVLYLDPRISVEEALARVPQMRQVAYAEPNYWVKGEEEPNDPLYDEAWSIGPSNASGVFSGIDTPSAWNVTVGAEDVTVGVVDSGIDLSHPDLIGNLWRNPGETGAGRESNGLDDDGNGFADDWQGWDWIEADNDPSDVNGHGTMVAGTVGAQGNNGEGATGVAWRAKLVPLRVLDDQGLGLTSDAGSAFSYAGSMGVRVVNASLTSTFPSAAMLAAIAGASNTLFVVAAGNDATNNDLSPKYPCNFELPNVMCVAATDEHNGLASFSNHGALTVDLAAPGTRILTTHPDGYVDFYGTSAATPHVSGVAALLLARHPGSSVETISNAIIQGSEPIQGLQGKTRSGGRLNAAGALRQLGDHVPEDRGSDRDDDRFDSQNSDEKKKKCRRGKGKRARRRYRRCNRRQ